MDKFRPYSEIEAERENHPWKSILSYQPGHKNYLAADYLPYKPNVIPLGSRILNSVIAICLVAYGLLGVYIDDLFIPGKRSSGIHLHGVAAKIGFFAPSCAAAACFAVVVDHYDKRPNEDVYMRLTTTLSYMSLGLFVFALVTQILFESH